MLSGRSLLKPPKLSLRGVTFAKLRSMTRQSSEDFYTSYFCGERMGLLPSSLQLRQTSRHNPSFVGPEYRDRNDRDPLFAIILSWSLQENKPSKQKSADCPDRILWLPTKILNSTTKSLPRLLEKDTKFRARHCVQMNDCEEECASETNVTSTNEYATRREKNSSQTMRPMPRTPCMHRKCGGRTVFRMATMHEILTTQKPFLISLTSFWERLRGWVSGVILWVRRILPIPTMPGQIRIAILSSHEASMSRACTSLLRIRARIVTTVTK